MKIYWIDIRKIFQGTYKLEQTKNFGAMHEAIKSWTHGNQMNKKFKKKKTKPTLEFWLIFHAAKKPANGTS